MSFGPGGTRLPFLTCALLNRVAVCRRLRISAEYIGPTRSGSIFLAAVALPARRDSIAASGFAPAYQRDYMVHRQLGGGYLLMAIITDPPGQLALPPLRPAKLPGLFFLLSELLRRYGYYERWFLSSLHGLQSTPVRRGQPGLPTRSGLHPARKPPC